MKTGQGSSLHGKRVRSQRLEVRCAEQQKQLIEKAAALQGRNVSDFVMSTLQEAALRTIRDHQLIELSSKDSEAFAKALINPAEPTSALKRAEQSHKLLIRKG